MPAAPSAASSGSRLNCGFRREPGNRLYIGQQSTENPRKFCFYEQYVDQTALDAHRAAPYFKQYVTDGLGPLIENISREFFRPAEEIGG